MNTLFRWQRLNRAHQSGRPSKVLAEAGVLMRVLDGEENPSKPWENDPHSPVGDRASVSLVNQRHPDIYECLTCPKHSQKMPGFVIASTPEVQKLIMCSYQRDGASVKNQCRQLGGVPGACDPGCTTHRCGNGVKWNCAYGASDLVQMMERQDADTPHGHVETWGYNEVRAHGSWARALFPQMIGILSLSRPSLGDVMKEAIHVRSLSPFGR